MHDHPGPSEILAAATAFLRGELLPELPPDLAFKTRVLVNALDLVARQIAESAPQADDEQAIALAERIEQGLVALDDQALVAHLWATALAKVAVDQPTYASYRAEMGADPRRVTQG
jgi:hypothetical protein